MATPYKKKSAEELKKELTSQVEYAFEMIEEHTQRTEDVLELSEFMSRFHHYSSRNMALLMSQFPHAYAVGSFKSYSEKGFKINKGEKALKILVPTPVTLFKNAKGEEKLISHATKEEKQKITAGIYQTEKKTHYKLGNVFDLSQTTATKEDLPRIFPHRHYDFSFEGQPDKLFQALQAVGDKLNTPIRDMADSVFPNRELGNSHGQFIYSTERELKEIRLNSRLSGTDKIHVTIHELAHASLHYKRKELSTSDKEFQAELTSHVVCKHFGIDTSEATIPYIASWTRNGQNLKDKALLMLEVHQTARNMITDIHHHFDNVPTLDTTQTTEVAKEKEKKPTQEHQSITKDMIERAKRVNIIDFATSQGIGLIQRAKNEFRLVDNNSVALFPKTNTFVDFEPTSNLKGDTIEFARKIVGIESFEEAVTLLNKDNYERVEAVSYKREPFVYHKEKESPTFTKARNYLVNERGLSGKLIDQLHDKGYIRQDKRGNVLFCWYDNQELIGVTEQGTYKSDKYDRGYWKGIQKNSPAATHGFNVCFGKPDHLKFFEASIDALSYASLHPDKLNNTWLISMEGLNERKMLDYVKRGHQTLGKVPSSISVGVDNDSSGLSFFKGLTRIKKDLLTNAIPDKPASMGHLEKWDWNDELNFQSGGSQMGKHLETEDSYAL